MNQLNRGNGWALIPLAVFLTVYLAVSIIVNDFYKVPMTVAFLISSVVAIAMTKAPSIEDRLLVYSQGAANRNILLMIWIFVMAGAFAQSAKAMGAIDATVNMAVDLLPAELMLAGLFVAGCFISMSVGTSVGTIVALAPVAAGMAEKSGTEAAFLLAVVVGGALFGDNLSFISDTTVAATKTQGVVMRDKFRVNILIVLPAALITLGLYVFQGMGFEWQAENVTVEYMKIIPYLVVLVTALMGIHVLLVLTLGLVSTAIIGIATGSFGILEWFDFMGKGILGMGELIIITLMAGGMLEVIRHNGGIDFIISRLVSRTHSKRGAELSIGALVSMTNACTANNTIAVITVGPIAKDIAERFGIDLRKSASILDTFSCVVQGMLPYGAQLLIGCGLANVSPIAVIPHLYYPVLMGLCALGAILFRYPKKYS